MLFVWGNLADCKNSYKKACVHSRYILVFGIFFFSYDVMGEICDFAVILVWRVVGSNTIDFNLEMLSNSIAII